MAHICMAVPVPVPVPVPVCLICVSYLLQHTAATHSCNILLQHTFATHRTLIGTSQSWYRCPYPIPFLLQQTTATHHSYCNTTMQYTAASQYRNTQGEDWCIVKLVSISLPNFTCTAIHYSNIPLQHTIAIY